MAERVSPDPGLPTWVKLCRTTFKIAKAYLTLLVSPFPPTAIATAPMMAFFLLAQIWTSRGPMVPDKLLGPDNL
jgi:hypothetical protein